MQGYHTVTTHCIGVVISRSVGRGSVSLTVPLIAVASRCVDDACSTLIDGQMQSHDVRATCVIDGSIGRSIGRSGVGGSVPCVAVASCNTLDGVGTTIDCEQEGSNTVTTHCIEGLVGIDSAGRIIVTIPCVVVTNGYGLAASGAMVDSQIKSHNAITASHICSGEGSRIVVDRVSHIMPCVTVASCDIVNGGNAVAQREV